MRIASIGNVLLVGLVLATRDPRDNDTRGVGAGAGAGTDTGDPDRRGSFESSGGSSGLGTYGKKVPGHERFDTKPNRLRDGG